MKDENSVPAAQKMTDVSLSIFRSKFKKTRIQMIDYRSLSVSDIRSTEAVQTGRAGAVRAEPQLKVLSYYSIRTIPIQDDVRHSTGASRAPSFRRPTTVVSVSSRRTV